MEIGRTLREARMKQGIDMTDLEASTKIRTKFLRALENEEWAVIGDDTYVRHFIRSYADQLGLDSRPLVEEYVISTAPVESGGGVSRPRRNPETGSRSRGLIVGVLLALVVVLAVVGGLKP
jgi:cytoskeletal protein RodZ